MTGTQPAIVGRYALFDEIAAGGMATVHLGRLIGPVGFSRTVAVKRLHAQFAKDSEFVAMFIDEARLAARIRHPNVVPTVDVVKTDDELFLVMEYVLGESLARLFTKQRRRGMVVDPGVMVPIVAQALHGLHAAHCATGERGEALKIVHRDVSPQNIMVGTDGVARVFDFGIAKARGRLQTTREGQLKGKLAYMAPEQLSGSPVTPQVDIYAASVVLWEALAGRRLFRADNEAVLLGQVLKGNKIPPSEFSPQVAAVLDEIVMCGMNVDASARFDTARAMAIALEKAVPCSSLTEIGEWVQEVATESLEKRARRVAEIESEEDINVKLDADAIRASDPDAEPALYPSQPSSISVTTGAWASRSKRGWPMVVMIAMMALFGGVLAVAVLDDASIGADSPKVTAPELPQKPAATAEPTSEAATPSPTSDNRAVESPASASASASAQPRKRTPRRRYKVRRKAKPPPPEPEPPPPRRVVAPPAPACNPPYTINSDGIRIPKPQCL